MPPLQALYRAAARDDRRLRPAEVGLPAIGHVGFFRERAQARLWPLALDWPAAQQAPTPAVGLGQRAG